MMDYRVKITIRNNRILNRMEEKGYPTMTSFSKALGVSQNQIQGVISGKIKPISKKGTIISPVKTMLDALDLSLEDAFTERQLKGFNKNSFEVTMDENQIHSITSPVKNTELLAMEQNIQSVLKNLMVKILKPRENMLIEKFYFQNKSLKELAKESNLTRTRIDQIIKKALFKLSKHYHEFDKSGITDVFPKVGNTSPLLAERRNSTSLAYYKKEKLN
jgi:RNA polymerase sigma factor (sigma-70 family)